MSKQLNIKGSYRSIIAVLIKENTNKMDIEIREVQTKEDLRKFVKFEIELLKEYKSYLPPLISDEIRIFSSKNPSLKYCDHKLFLAYRGGKIAGRVAAIINKRSNERWETKRVRFGWFDFIEDIEVCKALLKAVKDFGKAHGMLEIQGPMGFTDMDKECWVIEGFEERQNISTLFNPKYYVDFITQLGYNKDCEWKQYEMPNPQVPEKMLRINQLIKEKYNLRTPKYTSIDKLKEAYGKKVFDCLNQSFSHLYGFVPLDKEEVEYYIGSFFRMLNPKLICIIVDEKDDVLGFGISFPSLNRGLKKAKGKLFPFGWIYILRSLKKYDTVDLMLNGVRPDWQAKGIHSIYYTQMTQTYVDMNIKAMYSNPQIVDNEAVKVWGKYENRETIRRAVFVKPLV